jgi:hypothetical protein
MARRRLLGDRTCDKILFALSTQPSTYVELGKRLRMTSKAISSANQSNAGRSLVQGRRVTQSSPTLTWSLTDHGLDELSSIIRTAASRT